MRRQADYCSEIVINDYIQNILTMPQIANKHGICITTVQDIVKRNNVPVKALNNRKNVFNYDYFNIINTKDKAYFLGWLYSDGNNYPPTGTIRLGIQESDIKILYILQSYVADNPFNIKTYKRDIGKNKAVLVLTNKLTSEALEKLGVVQNKTFLLKFPTNEQVPKEFIHHFIRGYFDGDGCITKQISKKSINPDYSFTICGNYNFLIECQNVLIDNLHLKRNKLIKNRSIYNLTYGGNKQVLKIYEWLYKDCGNLYLERKKLKFEELCKK